MTDVAERPRLHGIDVLRGLVIVIMVLDHTREYSTGPSVSDPMQLDAVPPLVFWMRWLTHFCAPVFTLLAGVSAGIQGGLSPVAAPWSWHHISRGAVLILLEFTVIWFAWTFSLVWPVFYAQVIWGIGCSLIVLGLLQRVPVAARVLLGVLCVAGHNALDAVHLTTPTWLHWLWAILHDRQVMPLWGDLVVRTSYPILPMIGLVLLGDGLGRWLPQQSATAQARALRWGGVGLLCIFLLLRSTNVYGDLHTAQYTGTFPHDLMAMLNVTKYPMSFAFVCMTLGPAALVLSMWSERVPGWTRPLRTLGQVPMFVYIAHLYLLHAGALVVALVAGIPWGALDFRATITGLPKGTGFPVWATIPVALAIVLAIYPAATWYARLRASKRYAVTRFI